MNDGKNAGQNIEYAAGQAIGSSLHEGPQEQLRAQPTPRHMANLMRGSAAHIRQLREQNTLLAAQVRVIDVFEMALGADRGGGMGVSGEDLPSKLERFAEDLEKGAERPVYQGGGASVGSVGGFEGQRRRGD